jgi:hypothetical protein
VAAKAASAEREARAAKRRAAGSSDPWTYSQLLTDREDRHRDRVQESTRRDYGPALGDLRRALGGVLPRSLTDEHFEAYKRAKLDGIDVEGGREPVRKLSVATVNKRLDLARRIIAEAIPRGSMAGPNPVEEVASPGDPKREQMVRTEAEMRWLIDAAGTLELRWCAASASSPCASARRPVFRSRPTTPGSARSAPTSGRPSSASRGRCAWSSGTTPRRRGVCGPPRVSTIQRTGSTGSS